MNTRLYEAAEQATLRVPLQNQGPVPRVLPPVMAPALGAAIAAIAAAEDLRSLERVAREHLAPLAGAETAALRPGGALPAALAAHAEKLDALIRRAATSDSLAWERQGSLYLAALVLQARGRVAGELLLAGPSGGVLQLMTSAVLLEVLGGPLALALEGVKRTASMATPLPTRRVRDMWHLLPEGATVIV